MPPFPLPVYLDHAATTPLDSTVIAAMGRCMAEGWQNPSALYAAAGNARREMRLARRQIAGMLGCDIQEVIFTSGGTEGNNAALMLAAGKHVVISAIEHPSVIQAARRRCAGVTLVQPDAQGVIQPDAVAAALRPDTALISVQFANNETGVLQPVAAIGRMAREKRIPYHCDGVQGFGQLPLRADFCDLMTLSAHKLYGPRGVGALYVRSGMMLPPLLLGGEQEQRLRAGTENVAAICGFGEAARLAQADMTARADRERLLMADFLSQLQSAIPGCRVLGEGAARLPGVAAVLLPGLDAVQAIADLDLLSVQVSGGAACRMQEGSVSPVYRGMGLSEQDARCVLRISIGRHTQKDALDYAAQCIRQVYEKRVMRT